MNDKCKSCVGCKYLFADGYGYSNYTWMDTFIRCALNKNKNLKKDTEEPCNWTHDPDHDNFPPTMHSRCEDYEEGPFFTLDPDGEDDPRESGVDEEVCSLVGWGKKVDEV